jgi:hypothetical protein
MPFSSNLASTVRGRNAACLEFIGDLLKTRAGDASLIDPPHDLGFLWVFPKLVNRVALLGVLVVCDNHLFLHVPEGRETSQVGSCPNLGVPAFTGAFHDQIPVEFSDAQELTVDKSAGRRVIPRLANGDNRSAEFL